LCRSPCWGGVGEKVLLIAVRRELNFVLDFNRAIGENVVQFGTPPRQHPADEQASMAISGTTLATEQSDSVFGSPRQKPVNGVSEGLLLGHRTVESVSLGVVVALLVRTPAECFSLKVVTGARRLQRRGKLIAVELRSKARIGIRANVDDDLDLLGLKQLMEGLKRMV
jgi:hypothetical protein